MKRTINDFLNNEVRSFSVYANQRTIPSMIDGFKPGQRKIMYTMLRRGESAKEIKCSSFAGEVITHAAYHHGNTSLEGTIVNMAQDFAGSNNYNWLEPIGQFGTRLVKDAAAPRYIFTEMTKNFRQFYKKDDDIILKFKDEDGDLIEPEFYLPIIPTVLLNGVDGMGTGFATKVLHYKAKDVIDSCIAVLTNKQQKTLVPWVKNYKGRIERDASGSVLMYGNIEVTGVFTVRITEIPIDYDLESYKAVLNKLEDNGIIKDYDDLSHGNVFEFEVKVPRDITALPIDKLLEKFKLVSKFSENLTLWTETGKIKVFGSVMEIVEHFIGFRVGKYKERIDVLIDLKEKEIVWLSNKLEFIRYWLKDSKRLTSLTKAELFADLENKKFIEIDKLLSNRIYNLTKEEVTKLENELLTLDREITDLKNTKPDELYRKELDQLKKDLKNE